MSDKTGIEWTDATWNPVTGCTEVSPGCDRCYAKTFAERWRGTPGHYYEHGFDVQLRFDKIGQPLRWRKSRRIFVNSMSDLFHDAVPDIYIAQVFAVMAHAHWHTFQILTKRHARMRSLLSSPEFLDKFDREFCRIPDWNDRYPDLDFASGNTHLTTGPLSNVWLGVSTENQQWADIRIPALLDTPAAVRFISAEPLLGPIDLTSWIGCPHDSLSGIDQTPLDSPTKRWRCDQCRASVIDGTVTNVGLHWVIAGGESGHGARPMHPEWPRSLRDQCQASGVAFLFKQWGEWAPGNHRDPTLDGQVSIPYRPDCPDPYPLGWVRRIGKKRAGRELDGRTWDQYPEAVTT